MEIKQTFIAKLIPADFHVYKKDYADHLKENRMRKIYIDHAWRSETLQTQVVVVAFDETLQNVKLTASDLTSENGRIPEASMDVFAVRETKGYMGRGGDWDNENKKESIPDILDYDLPQVIAEKTMQVYWLSIHIPEDAAAGKYDGTVAVTCENTDETVTLELAIEVLPLTQPKNSSYEKTAFGVELWEYPYTLARYYGIQKDEWFGERHQKLLRHHMEEYREAGGDTISVTIVEDPWNSQTFDPYPSMVRWVREVDGTFTFDYTHFDAYVALAIECGVDKYIKSFSMVPWKNRVMYFDKRKNKMVESKPIVGWRRWKNLWNTFVADYVKHLEEKGWFERTYIAMDERPLRIMQPVIDLLNGHKNNDGQRLKISGAMDYNKIGSDVLNEIEDISIALTDIDPDGDGLRKLARDRRSRGMRTTMYTCVGHYPNSFARSQPVESAWTIWYAVSQELDGYLRWAFDAWNDKPLSDISYKFWEAGDPFLIYPGSKEEEFPRLRSTPRFERMKDGVRDAQKLHYLMEQDEEMKEKILTLLHSLKRPLGKTNKYFAMESGSVENDTVIRDEVHRMKAELYTITKEYIEK